MKTACSAGKFVYLEQQLIFGGKITFLVVKIVKGMMIILAMAASLSAEQVSRSKWLLKASQLAQNSVIRNL